MGLFGKPKDYEYQTEKESDKNNATIEIDITHFNDTGVNFDIKQKEEYSAIKALEELSSGLLESYTFTSDDGGIIILSSLYIRNSVILITK